MMPPTPRSRRAFVLIGAALLASLAAGCNQRPSGGEEERSPAPVKWEEARQLFPQEWTEVLGATQPLPERFARVTAPVEGRVVAVLPGEGGKPLTEGQRVEKGAVIVRLDDSVAKANLARAEAALAEAKHEIELTDLGVQLADVEVKRLEDLGRVSSTNGSVPLVSRVEREKAKLMLDEAKAKKSAAELHRVSVEKEAEALREQWKLSTLTAPIKGVLGRIMVVPGQTVAPGTPVAEITDLDEAVDLLCFVPPRLARKLKEGQSARVGGFDEKSPESGSSPEGRVAFVAHQAEPDTGNFAVKVRFPNDKLGLRGNTAVRLLIQTDPGRACLTLPESAILEDQDPPAVIVVEDYKVEKNKDGKEEETGKARKLRVKLGIRDRVLHVVEVVGLEDPEKKWHGTVEGAKFVIERGRGLRTGDAIKLEVEEDEAEEK